MRNDTRSMAALARSSFIFGCLLMVTLTSLVALAQTPPPLKFASSSDYSASGRSITNSYHAGVRIAFDEINARGGYNGRRLEFITMDDGYVASRTRENVETLYNAHPDLIAFVAGLGTANTLASVSFAANRSIGIFFPATGAESLRNPFVRVVPNLVASYSFEAAFSVKYATQVLKLNRISIIFQNDAFGEPPATLARNKLRDMGITPFTVASYPTGSMNMTGAVQSLLSKEWLPQAVLMYTFGPQTAMIIQEYQARTQYPTKFILMSVADFVNLRSIMGSSGVYENVYLIRSAPDPNDSSFLISQRFNAAANLYNATVYREHYTMLGYMAGHMVHQVLTRHDSRTNVTSASFLNTLYNTNVFNVFGLTVGPYSDASPGACNQGLRQLWLSQATNTGWRAVTNEPGLGALLEPWPSMCVYQESKSRLPSIWGLGISPQDTSPLAKDYIAGVKASVRYFNEIEGGGLAQFVVHAEDIDWTDSKVSSVNPVFAGTAAPVPSNAVQRFLNEYRVAGLIGSSHLSISGGTTSGELSELLSDLQGRPVVGVLGGDAPFYDTPSNTQIVPHRSSYLSDFYGLLDALYIRRNLKRIGLLCITGDGPQFGRICAQARRAFDTLNMVPAFAREFLLTPSAPLLEETLTHLPLQDDMSLTGTVDGIIYVGPNALSFSQVMINLVSIQSNVTVGVGSYLDTTNAFIPTKAPPILQVRTVPPRGSTFDKYSSIYDHLDAIGKAFSIPQNVRETSGFIQGFLTIEILIRGISSLSDPENGASFVRATLLNREYLLFDWTEKPVRIGPYLDPLTAQCTQPTNASSCAQPFCRQGLTSVFVQPVGSPSTATEEYAYPTCGVPPSASQRTRIPICEVRHIFGKSIWTDMQRAMRYSPEGTIFYTVVMIGLFVLVLGSALVGVTRFKYRERKKSSEKARQAAKQTSTSSMLMGGAPKSSKARPSFSRATSQRSAVGGRGSAMDMLRAGGGMVQKASLGKDQTGEQEPAKKEPVVMIRPSTANYLAMFGVFADFAGFTYLFLPTRIAWVGTFAHTIVGIPESDTIVANNWFGLFFAYLYLAFVFCLGNKTLLQTIQLHAPLVFVVAGYLLPMYSWILIPIVKDLLWPFTIICTQNHCFLDDDCTGLVWTPSHFATAAFSGLALWLFVPSAVFFSNAWWKIQHHVDIIESNAMTMSMTLTKIVLITLNSVLPHNFGEVQIIQVLAMLALLGLVNSRNWTQVQWWPTFKGIGISCALTSAIVGLVGEAVGVRDAIAFLAALIVAWLGVLVTGTMLICRRHKAILIPRAREQRRLQSRFAKLMAFNATSDGSSSFASSDDSSLDSDTSSMHSIAGLSKPAIQTLVGWILTLEKKQVLSASETTWLLGDADKRKHGFVSILFSAVGGEVAGSMEKLQKLLMESPAIEAVRAIVNQAAEAAAEAKENSSGALAGHNSTVRFSAALSSNAVGNSPASQS